MSHEEFEALFSALQTRYQQGDYIAVLQHGEKLLAQMPWQKFASSPEDAGQPFVSAEAFLKQVSQAEESFVWRSSPYLNLLVWCAESAYALKNRDTAQYYLEQALAFSPQAELWHLKARWLQAEGDTEAAIKALGQAIKQDRHYIAAYEDLVTLANTAHLPELAFEILQQASHLQMTPQLLTELFLISSQTDFVQWRSLFIELCVQQLTDSTADALCDVLLQLSAQADDYHCTYLGFHLLSYGVRYASVRQAYVMSALRQQQLTQLLQLLLTWPAFERDALFFYHVGQGFLHWRMPRFARHFFVEGMKNVEPETPWYQALKEAHDACESGLEDEDFFKSCLKRMGVDPTFKAQFCQEPQAFLARYQVSWSAPWQRLWKMLGGAVI